MTNLHEQLVIAEGRVREMEAILERGTVELEELKEDHRRTQASLEIKNQEVRGSFSAPPRVYEHYLEEQLVGKTGIVTIPFSQPPFVS